MDDGCKWEANKPVGEAERLWNDCLLTLRPLVPEAAWNSCFQQTWALALDGSALMVAVPSSLVRERLQSRWRSQVNEALALAGGNGIEVQFCIRTDDSGTEEAGTEEAGTEASAPGPPPDETNPVQPDGPAPTRSGTRRPAPPSPASGSLNPNHTFEAFVTGKSNRFSQAAAQAVAETPGRQYNPLYLYGAPGLGKTHLLQAIGNYVHEHYPAYGVCYVSCEAFVSDYVDAIRTNNVAPFKRRYRDVHLLLLDDMQFMLDKERSTEEFLHTFNVLHGSGRQIVITSDRSARAMAPLPERLRSRLEWGLTSDIRPPELETRLAILRKKAERGPISIPDDVLEFIATNIKNNIRELEGALNRVTAYASLYRVPLSVDLGSTILADVLRDSRPRVITAEIIIAATALMYGFSVEELCGRSRRRPLVTARQVSMYLCRELTDLSYPAIARAYGGRDHTTVIHAVEKIGALMAERHHILEQVEQLDKAIREGR